MASIQSDFKRRSIAPAHSKKIHNAYYAMVKRCYKESDSRYKTYGGRGITVCDRWLGKDGLTHFIEDMGEPAEHLSIDRIDNDKNYSPENCQWIPKALQARNKTTTRYYELDGKKMLLGDIAKEYGIERLTLYRRMKVGGMSLEDAVKQPVQSPDEMNKFGLIYQGSRVSVNKLAKMVGLNRSTLSMRLYKYGWSIDKAISTPIGKRG